MSARRLTDQVLVLEAIGQVRSELKRDMSMFDKIDVMTRLATLYSLVDVTRLKSLVEKIDDRNWKTNKEAA